MEYLSGWHVWVILALILAGLELLGAHFILLALGVSALGGALAAALGVGLNLQLISVAVTALVLVPLFVRKIHPRLLPGERYGTLGSGAEAGQLAEVISGVEGKLAVRLSGNEFPLRWEGKVAPMVGETVRIVSVEGITVRVERLAQTP
ncbi:NfeD family protein [Cobetia sp. L2A1]|uniref:NfeD family protein n=1 Tax=Cobetia sp. L2A1 TaxID=2686360 RepID=UPI00131C51FA|nr:NfeD family protein [Cobetia sp. L2A1]